MAQQPIASQASHRFNFFPNISQYEITLYLPGPAAEPIWRSCFTPQKLAQKTDANPTGGCGAPSGMNFL
jgi:hypothetical protein